MTKTYEQQKKLMEGRGTRGYLYGRLLAMYQLAESEIFEDTHITKAELVWDKMIIKPEETMLALERHFKTLKIKERLIQKSDKTYEKFKEEFDYIKSEIVELYGPTLEDGKKNLDYGKPVDEMFVFGFEAQKLLWELKMDK